MAKVVTCPSCQAKGSIPDDSKAAQDSLPQMRPDVRRQGSVGWADLGYHEETGLLRWPAARRGAPLRRL